MPKQEEDGPIGLTTNQIGRVIQEGQLERLAQESGGEFKYYPNDWLLTPRDLPLITRLLLSVPIQSFSEHIQTKYGIARLAHKRAIEYAKQMGYRYYAIKGDLACKARGYFEFAIQNIYYFRDDPRGALA